MMCQRSEKFSQFFWARLEVHLHIKGCLLFNSITQLQFTVRYTGIINDLSELSAATSSVDPPQSQALVSETALHVNPGLIDRVSSSNEFTDHQQRASSPAIKAEFEAGEEHSMLSNYSLLNSTIESSIVERQQQPALLVCLLFSAFTFDEFRQNCVLCPNCAHKTRPKCRLFLRQLMSITWQMPHCLGPNHRRHLPFPSRW
jgi:hypothetical protein